MTDPATPLLEARAISKSFAQTRALVDAQSDVCVPASPTHCSARTGRESRRLSRVISGHVRRDSGEIVYRGQPLDVRSPREALDAGIAMVMQETSLAPDLSVLENIFLPDLGRPGRLSRPGHAAARGRDPCRSRPGARACRSTPRRATFPRRSASLSRSPRRSRSKPISSFSTSRPPRLSPSEVERLFDVIARLESAQCAIVFVSHRLEEVFAISDEITVMREGRTVAASRPTSSLNQTELIRLMVGRDIGSIYAAPAAPPEDARGADSVRARPARAAARARRVLRPSSRRDPRARRPCRRGAVRDRGDAVRPAPARRRRGSVRGPAVRAARAG